MPIEAVIEKPPMKVYIAGPMSGLPEYNYLAFYAGEEVLRRQGLNPQNPARNPEQKTWQAYMRQAITLMLQCEAVYFLPGWGTSSGALIEHDLAHTCGLGIVYPEDWCPEFPDPWGSPFTYINKPLSKEELLQLEKVMQENHRNRHLEVVIEGSSTHKKALQNLRHLLRFMRESPVPLPDEENYSGLTRFGAYKNGWRAAVRYIEQCAQDSFEF